MFQAADHRLYFTPSTEIVASQADILRTSILQGLDDWEGWDSFVLNLEYVHKVDSIGINLIVGLFKEVQNRNASFMIINCNSSIMKVLKLFRLNKKFDIGMNSDYYEEQMRKSQIITPEMREAMNNTPDIPDDEVPETKAPKRNHTPPPRTRKYKH